MRLRDLLGLEHVVERVVERAQVGIDLLFEVAGQEAEALPRLDRGPRENDPRDLALHERRHGHGHRQKRLAGARGPDAEHDVVGSDRVEVALLPARLGGDPLLAEGTAIPSEKTALRSAPSSSFSIRRAARTSPERMGAPARTSSASWAIARSARRTWRSSPRSMRSWPRATMRTSNSDSSVLRWSSLRPSRCARSTSGAREMRRVVVVASLNSDESLAESITQTAPRPRGPGAVGLRQVEADVQLPQPLAGRPAGRLHQQVLGLLVHREGDDLADVRLVGEEHDDAVDARRRARRAAARRSGTRSACRRSAPRPPPAL